MSVPHRRLTDGKKDAWIPDALRPHIPGVIAWASSGVAAWLTSKGYEMSMAQVIGIFGPLAHVLGKLLSARLNPNDAAAPSLVRHTNPERLDTRLDAEVVNPPPSPPQRWEFKPAHEEPVVEDFRPPAEPLAPPPAFERSGPPVAVVEEKPAAPPKKKRASRRKAVIPPTPGAPQPDVPSEPSEGFEP